jgi:hypothetical protein
MANVEDAGGEILADFLTESRGVSYGRRYELGSTLPSPRKESHVCAEPHSRHTDAC